MKSGDQYVTLIGADGKAMPFKLTPATKSGQQFIPVQTADGKVVPMAVKPVTKSGQNYFPVTTADGKVVPMQGAGGYGNKALVLGYGGLTYQLGGYAFSGVTFLDAERNAKQWRYSKASGSPAVGSHCPYGFDYSPRCVGQVGSDIIVGGAFVKWMNDQCRYWARYDEVNDKFVEIGDGNNRTPLSGRGTLSAHDRLYAIYAPAYSSQLLWYWDGSSWTSMGWGGTSSPATLRAWGTDKVVALGSFTAGPAGSKFIAIWDKTTATWSSPGTFVGSYVWDATEDDNGDLVVVGSFSTINGNTFNSIAKWDGANWTAMGTGLKTAVGGVGNGTWCHQFAGKTWVAGTFAKANDHDYVNYVRWDETAGDFENWVTTTTPVVQINSSAVIDNELVIMFSRRQFDGATAGFLFKFTASGNPGPWISPALPALGASTSNRVQLNQIFEDSSGRVWLVGTPNTGLLYGFGDMGTEMYDNPTGSSKSTPGAHVLDGDEMTGAVAKWLQGPFPVAGPPYFTLDSLGPIFLIGDDLHFVARRSGSGYPSDPNILRWDKATQDVVCDVATPGSNYVNAWSFGRDQIFAHPDDAESVIHNMLLIGAGAGGLSYYTNGGVQGQYRNWYTDVSGFISVGTQAKTYCRAMGTDMALTQSGRFVYHDGSNWILFPWDDLPQWLKDRANQYWYENPSQQWGYFTRMCKISDDAVLFGIHLWSYDEAGEWIDPPYFILTGSPASPTWTQVKFHDAVGETYNQVWLDWKLYSPDMVGIGSRVYMMIHSKLTSVYYPPADQVAAQKIFWGYWDGTITETGANFVTMFHTEDPYNVVGNLDRPYFNVKALLPMTPDQEEPLLICGAGALYRPKDGATSTLEGPALALWDSDQGLYQIRQGIDGLQEPGGYNFVTFLAELGDWIPEEE